jgi:hypothetical protein
MLDGAVDSKTNIDPFVKASQFRFRDLAAQVTALQQYNLHPATFLPAPKVLQLIIDNAGTEGTRRPTLTTTVSILESIERSYGVAAQAQRLRFPLPEPDEAGRSTRGLDRIPESESMSEAASIISNPGSVGQMLNYVLDRYAPHTHLVKTFFGFTPEDICRIVRLIQRRMNDIISPFMIRRIGQIEDPARTRYRRKLDTPRKDFLAAWQDAITLGPSEITKLTEFGPAQEVVAFLTEEATAFSSRGDSFSRWNFVRVDPTKFQLVVPWTLAETVTSSIHLALLENLPQASRGAYGLKLGKVFEKLVRALFERWSPGILVESRKSFPGQRGDIDLMVRISRVGWLLLQCKGRALRPEGRWGRTDHYEADLKRNIDEAAIQARRALEAIPGRMKVESVLIVLDAYFPNATMFTHSGGPLDRSLAGLPKPVVIAYYDLDYLLRKIPQSELLSYLDWRQDILREGRFLLADELDLLRLYQKRHEGIIDVVRDREMNLAFVGSDREFEADTLREIDFRLFGEG